MSSIYHSNEPHTPMSSIVSLPSNFTEAATQIHANNVAKGFYDNENELMAQLTDASALANLAIAFKMARLGLVGTEVSEAVEAVAKNRNCQADIQVIALIERASNEEYSKMYEEMVKDTLGAELAGTIIRVLDLCGRLEIDIHHHILAELRYNLTRPRKHGKNY